MFAQFRFPLPSLLQTESCVIFAFFETFCQFLRSLAYSLQSSFSPWRSIGDLEWPLATLAQNT
jgi:hypothetical protein